MSSRHVLRGPSARTLCILVGIVAFAHPGSAQIAALGSPDIHVDQSGTVVAPGDISEDIEIRLGPATWCSGTASPTPSRSTGASSGFRTGPRSTHSRSIPSAFLPGSPSTRRSTSPATSFAMRTYATSFSTKSSTRPRRVCRQGLRCLQRVLLRLAWPHGVVDRSRRATESGVVWAIVPSIDWARTPPKQPRLSTHILLVST